MIVFRRRDLPTGAKALVWEERGKTVVVINSCLSHKEARAAIRAALRASKRRWFPLAGMPRWGDTNGGGRTVSVILAAGIAGMALASVVAAMFSESVGMFPAIVSVGVLT